MDGVQVGDTSVRIYICDKSRRRIIEDGCTSCRVTVDDNFIKVCCQVGQKTTITDECGRSHITNHVNRTIFNVDVRSDIQHVDGIQIGDTRVRIYICDKSRRRIIEDGCTSCRVTVDDNFIKVCCQVGQKTAITNKRCRSHITNHVDRTTGGSILDVNIGTNIQHMDRVQVGDTGVRIHIGDKGRGRIIEDDRTSCRVTVDDNFIKVCCQVGQKTTITDECGRSHITNHVDRTTGGSILDVNIATNIQHMDRVQVGDTGVRVHIGHEGGSLVVKNDRAIGRIVQCDDTFQCHITQSTTVSNIIGCGHVSDDINCTTGGSILDVNIPTDIQHMDRVQVSNTSVRIDIGHKSSGLVVENDCTIRCIVQCDDTF